MKIEGNKIILTFANVGRGWVVKNGSKLNCFEICGIDDEYFPAEAKIEHNAIVIWSDKVASPVSVRYAWADNSVSPNLFNKEELPVTPFKQTDENK
jgi:sialate O-acetylesterase